MQTTRKIGAHQKSVWFTWSQVIGHSQYNTFFDSLRTDILFGGNNDCECKYDGRSVVIIEFVHEIVIDPRVEAFEYGC